MSLIHACSSPLSPGSHRNVVRFPPAGCLRDTRGRDFGFVTGWLAVVPRNITGAFRQFHKLSKTFSNNELTGPTYQRYFVAERCAG